MEKTLKEEDLVRLDLTTRPLWVQELAKELLKWALDLYSKGCFDRDDYAEFLRFVIFHLGGDVKGFWPLRVPGPDHQARWMADCIYYQKILSCSQKFYLSEEELRQAENITEFIVILYFKPWFQCTLASEAALSDLTFLCLLQRRYRWGKYNISLNSSPSPGCPRCGRCWRPSTASCGTSPGR